MTNNPLCGIVLCMNKRQFVIAFDAHSGESKVLSIETETRPDGQRCGKVLRSLLCDRFTDTPCVQKFNSLINPIESMVLIHACCGVDIETPGYVEGVRVAYENACNTAF
jgi:hypothetical protein